MGVARLTGLEPVTSDVTGRRSNQLSYNRSDTKMEPRCRIELRGMCLYGKHTSYGLIPADTGLSRH